VRIALSELNQLRSSAHSIQFAKRNLIHPFEDSSSLQFWSVKNDASLFLIGSDSKKRPDNLTFVRMFDHQVLDMVEVGIEGAVSLADIKGPKASPGLIPLFHFVGTLWDSNERYKQFKSMLLDFFRGQEIHSIDLVHGLQYVISVSVGELDQPGTTTSLLNATPATLPTPTEAPQQTIKPQAPKPVSLVDSSQPNLSGNVEGLPIVHFRTYLVQLLKSGQREPRVELLPHGPSFDFRLRRAQAPSEDLLKQSLQRHLPKKPMGENKKARGNKNVDIDEMGDKVGKIHVGQQELAKLQSRKMKGLKKEKKDKKKSSGRQKEDADADQEGSQGEIEMDDQAQADEMGAIVELEQSRVTKK
jgi:ribosome production factor 2